MAGPGSRGLFLRQARRVGLPVVGHVSEEATDLQVADSGQRSVEHFDHIQCWKFSTILDPQFGEWTFDRDTAAAKQRCAATVAAFAHNGTWFTPTAVIAHRMTTRVLRQDVAPIVRMLHGLGFKRFLAGADVLRGFSEQRIAQFRTVAQFSRMSAVLRSTL